MTAQSFTAFLNEHRLNAAAAALRAGDDTVLAIAESCGFENLSYFNRMFKRKFGLTPRSTAGDNMNRAPPAVATVRPSPFLS